MRKHLLLYVSTITHFYVRFKVQYEESRAQCGHYNLLLSSTRITLCGCAVNNQKQILED